MKTILLPTDFSSHSDKALDFAIEIAKKTNAKILVAHAFHVPVIDASIPPDMIDDMSEAEKSYAEEKLKEICGKISRNISTNGRYLKSSYDLEYTIPISEISNLCKEKEVDLIVMGTEEKEEYMHLALGSTTVEVVNKVDCPVLIVKTNTNFNSFKKIFFALENINEDILTLKNLLPIAKLFNSEITLIHVNAFATCIEELSYNHAEEARQKTLLTSIKESLNYPNISLKTCSADETMEGFNRLIKNDKPDLIALLKYKRNWLENLFHKSVIKSAIKNSQLPLLVIHKKG